MPAGSLLPNRDITRLPEHKRAAFIGRVFQDPAKGPCPDLTILENMALADNKKAGIPWPPPSAKRIDAYRSMLEICNMGLENRLGQPVGSPVGADSGRPWPLVIAGMTDIDILVLDEHTRRP